MSTTRILEDPAHGFGGLLRAALPSLPGINLLPGVRKAPGPFSELAFTRPSVMVNREHAMAYASVCGFPAKDSVPLTYPHVLGFGLHMSIMTDPQFPYPAIGTVHLANSITGHRAIHPGEELMITARAESPRPHPKGVTVDFLTEVYAGEDLVWESTSTYLRRGVSTSLMTEAGTPTSASPTAAPELREATEEDAGATIQWRLPANLGRRYASVSGDHNPIHLSPLTARALGFRRQIAHGMWSLGRCVAAIENRLPEAVTVDVAFKKPIFLPGTVAFGLTTVAKQHSFSLTRPKDGSPHLIGRATPA